MLPRFFRAAAAGIAAIALSAAIAARPQGQPPNPQDLIPFDPGVRTGTLPNGIKYFIRSNSRPARRISMRLAVKAGSIHESDDQQGLAHVIEHMAFNGSTHFKPGEVFSYFESVGARLGPHVNAYTSFDETVYRLDLPTDQSEVVTKGFTALADFAGGLTIDAGQVDKERGVVIEEWRGGLGAGSRIRDKQLPLFFYKSRYAERLPIGKPDVIRTAPAARLRSFYDTWYRPERSSVIAVGDLDAAQMETAITAAFTPLRARAAAQPAPATTVPLRHPLLVSVVTDPEAADSSVQVLRKRTKDGDQRVGDYRRNLIRRMVEHMINDRFGELARKPEATFLSAGASDGAISQTVSAFSLEAGVPDGKLEEGVALIAAEAKRVRDFGFSASEVDRAKRWLAAFYDRAFNERDKTESGSFAQEYLSYFLEGEPSPGIAYEHALVRQLLPGVTAAEASALARRLLADDSRVLLAISPRKPGIRIPSETALQATLAAAERTPIAAWDDTVTSQELVATKPPPGTVESRREVPSVGVTIVKFANGVEAWLKPTDFKNDQVLFSLDARGGASLASEDSYLEAMMSTGLVRLSGVGGLKPTDLQKLLAGKLASAAPFMGLSTHGISGSAAPADLETALQLLYQTFVAPGNDPDAFTLMKRQLDASVANREQSPEAVFGDRLAQLNTSNHYATRPLTAARLAALSRERMTTYYRQRFSNAADFTLFMVGAFTVNDALPLLARYVGSLPSTGVRTSDFKDVGLRFPTGTERVRVEKGREPRSETVISFFADAAPTPAVQERLAQATAVLQMALRDILRESLGQTYTVSVGFNQSLPQRGDGHVMISFGAAPENVQPMVDRVMREVERLRREGPSDDLTNRAKESARRDHETALRQNGYWLGRLQTVELFGTDPGDIARRTERIAAVTPLILQETFKQFFPADRHTVATLVPQP